MSLLVSAIVVLILASCGGGKKANTIKPVSEKINGPLGQYFEVVIKDYKANDRDKVSIEFKRIQDGFPAPWNPNMKVGYSDGCFEPLFTAEFQDEDGNVLSKDKTDIVWDRDDLEALAALQVDETCTLGFDVGRDNPSQVKITSTFEVHGGSSSYSSNYDIYDDNNGADKYVVINTTNLRLRYGPSLQADTYKKSDGTNQHPNKGQKFLYLGEENDFYNIDYYGNSLWVAKEFSYIDGEGPVGDDDFGFDVANASSSDLDQFINEYERFVNSCVNLINKANNGDVSALAEYAEMLEKAERMSDQLESAKGELTAAQLNRLAKAEGKVASVATKISGLEKKVNDLIDKAEDFDVDDVEDAVNSMLNGLGNW